MAKCCCAGLGWDRVAVMGLCSGFVLKTVLITTRLFPLLHRVKAFSVSYPVGERAESRQDVGPVTADPNRPEEHSIPYSIVFSNKISRSLSGLLLFGDCLGLAGGK